MSSKNLKLHDFEIIGLEISRRGRSKKLEMKLMSENGKIKIIHFDEISFLNCSDFSWQNVISEAHVFDIATTEKATIIEIIQQAGIDINQMNADLSLISTGVLIDIQASVGAQIICICERIRED